MADTMSKEDIFGRRFQGLTEYRCHMDFENIINQGEVMSRSNIITRRCEAIRIHRYFIQRGELNQGEKREATEKT